MRKLHYPVVLLLFLTSSLLPLYGADKSSTSSPTGIYTGRLGTYESLLVMRLTESNGVLTGSYQYVKHGKPLLLQGRWDAETGQGTMTEDWEGTQTGTFEFTRTEDGLQGQWMSAETDPRPHHLTLTKVPGDPHAEPENANWTRLYTHTHASWILENDEKGEAKRVEFDTTSWVRFVPVNDSQVAFYYQVYGGNGHQGQADGIATWSGEDNAEWVQTDGYLPDSGPCRLSFAFTRNQVEVAPASDCSHLGGARIGLPGGTYLRK